MDSHSYNLGGLPFVLVGHRKGSRTPSSSDGSHITAMAIRLWGSNNTSPAITSVLLFVVFCSLSLDMSAETLTTAQVGGISIWTPELYSNIPVVYGSYLGYKSSLWGAVSNGIRRCPYRFHLYHVGDGGSGLGMLG
ncbi:hypothetical protein BD410DRAFT_796932 [Rickenella mellea]|uniref:Uncharacterized protein n=1 Tax=Rickenella mellea TaxID=50990 RepID=A0A4Y7PIJ5_9AGAM|nr:hypothetical protein BD410DRAFT_796932 [Rickenella mellea]